MANDPKIVRLPNLKILELNNDVLLTNCLLAVILAPRLISLDIDVWDQRVDDGPSSPVERTFVRYCELCVTFLRNMKMTLQGIEAHISHAREEAEDSPLDEIYEAIIHVDCESIIQASDAGEKPTILFCYKMRLLLPRRQP